MDEVGVANEDQKLFEQRLKANNVFFDTNYVNADGNIRVIRVYWKSYRKVLRVKSYDVNGKEVYNLYPETYKVNENLGEEAKVLWINEAWEGTKVGKDIYVNMRPRPIQFNSLSNPSKCHFGIVGSIMSVNDSKPYSLLDSVKPYIYLYDVIQDRLNRVTAMSLGNKAFIDFASMPKGWSVEKYLFYAKNTPFLFKDSFKEGTKGQATGKLAGMMSGSQANVNLSQADMIQTYQQFLQFIHQEIYNLTGITPQRLGSIKSTETVGGVERAVIQSSHITEWYYALHEDVKRRVLTAFVEVAKAAIKGGSLKFQNLLDDGSLTVSEVDGDAFADADYGVLITSNAKETLVVRQKLDMYAQQMLSQGQLTASILIKTITSNSISDIIRTVEEAEAQAQQRQAEAQQRQEELSQQQLQQKQQAELAKMQLEDAINQRDNDTRLMVAQIQGEASRLKTEIEAQTQREGTFHDAD